MLLFLRHFLLNKLPLLLASHPNAYSIMIVPQLFLQRFNLRNLTPLISTKKILSKKSGTLLQIDQKNLGFFINFTLGGAGSSFTRSFNPQSSIRLNKLIGDHVAEGEILCWVFHDEAVHIPLGGVF
ncbi:MAG: hypothetical protein H0X29_05990 [Parachlamydiaceae bacterium]|nr:hypothetical protein [Parachlamydiaceae bacterium]